MAKSWQVLMVMVSQQIINFFPKIEEYGLIIIRIIELVMDPETLNKS